MKKLIYILLFLSIFLIADRVYAASLSISGPSDSNTDTSYTLTISYSGDQSLASGTVVVSYENANCTLSTSASGALANGNKITINNVDGLGTSATIGTLTCTSSSAGTATFSASSSDMYDVEVNEIASESNIINGGKSVTINAPAPPPANPNDPGPSQEPDPTPEPEKPKEKEKEKEKEPTPEPVNPDGGEKEPDPVPKIKIDLTTFEIVGYTVNYNIDKDQYTIDVDSNVTDLYLNIVPSNPDVVVENVGKVDIKGKTSIQVKLTLGNDSRIITINLNRTSPDDSGVYGGATPTEEAPTCEKSSSGGGMLPIISYILNVLLIAALVFMYMKSKKTEEYSDVEDVDVEATEALDGAEVAQDAAAVAVAEQPVQVAEQPVQVAEQPVQVAEQPVQVAEQPVQVAEQPVQISEQPTQAPQPVQVAPEQVATQAVQQPPQIQPASANIEKL